MVKLDLGDPAKDHLALRYFLAERELRETLKALGLDRKSKPPLTALDWAKRVA